MTNVFEVTVPSQGALGGSHARGGLFGTGARALTLFVFGLFVLAGVTTHPETALAQAQDDCPLTPGVTRPPDPAVTAQDVENDNATLEDFALAVRAQFKSRGTETVSAEQFVYAGCRLRLEGGPFRSGSTYIVTLTPDGRVYLHAKDMSLSAGSLKPVIYAGILSVLGVPGPVLAGLQSPDPVARSRAQSTLLEILKSEQHGSFDLTSAVAGVRPGIPGASGYAAAYVSVNTEQPLVLLAGFELDASHLRDEDIDFGNPAITARDVVDRETLKEFVTEALRFLGSTLSSTLYVFSSGPCPEDFGVCDCVEGLVEREHEAAHVTDIFPSVLPGPVEDTHGVT